VGRLFPTPLFERHTTGRSLGHFLLSRRRYPGLNPFRVLQQRTTILRAHRFIAAPLGVVVEAVFSDRRVIVASFLRSSSQFPPHRLTTSESVLTLVFCFDYDSLPIHLPWVRFRERPRTFSVPVLSFLGSRLVSLALDFPAPFLQLHCIRDLLKSARRNPP